MNNLPIILRTDGYKITQWNQYPSDTAYITSYIEARGGAEESVFFGLQAFIKEYLLTPITMADIDFAESVIMPYIGYFNREGWEIIVNDYNGYLPVSIEAVPEGTVMPVSNIQVRVTNTDPRLYWLTSYLETAILRGVWYPSTVATKSREMKKHLVNAIKESSDIAVEDLIPFMLHDFGSRGVSSPESAMLGGMAHLTNFVGTDTVEAIYGVAKYYNESNVGASIPASEHSTMTSWGKDREVDAYENMINLFSGEGKLLAIVIDSYDVYNAARNLLGKELKTKIIASKGRIIARPDSGSPTYMPIKVAKILMEEFGFTTNSKGYKVLPDYIRVIQGDGITDESLPLLLTNIIDAGMSVENFAFGMGGGLLQKVGRDDLEYAMKASARCDTSGIWHDVFKAPLHGNKTSKKGRLALSYTVTHGFSTKRKEDVWVDVLEPVFLNGKLLRDTNFSEVIARTTI